MKDTDNLKYSIKGNQLVQKWMRENQSLPKCISVITYGELIYGARKSRHPEKNTATANRIAQLFHVIDINREIIEVFSEIKAKLEKSGTRLDDMDLMIAATAMYMNYALVTNNGAHFKRIDGLTIENWEGAGADDPETMLSR